MQELRRQLPVIYSTAAILLCSNLACITQAQEPAVLGVVFDDIRKSDLERLQLDGPVGSIVHCVLPAVQYDVMVGDVVVAANGKPILDTFDFTKATAGLSKGQSISVELIRGGEKIEAEWIAVLTSSEFESEVYLLAEQGNLWAQICLQSSYSTPNQSELVLSNQKTFNYFEKLLASADPAASYCVGLCYEFGVGTSLDKKEAARWYRKAARQEYPAAMVRLALGYHHRENPSYAQVVSWASKGAERNHVEAINCLGWCYEFGMGVPQDYERAFQYYLSAAGRKYDHAQFCVGHMLRTGVAGNQDLPGALSWYEKASAQGHADAAFQVGYAYEWGVGIEADYERAEEMYLLSIQGGSVAGQWGLGSLHLNGHGRPVDYPKAIKQFKLAADAGYADGYHTLAYMFENGQGLPRNGTLATLMYVKAEKLGSYYATQQLQKRFARPPQLAP